MKRAFFYVLEQILFFSLLPYVVVYCVHGKEMAVSERKVEAELLVGFSLMYQIPKEYELEMIKAQAVIARTNLYKEIEQGKNIGQLVKENFLFIEVIPDKVYREAVKETEGILLLFNEELKELPYHEMSNGMTRNGIEVLHEEEYDYLKAVESTSDKEGNGYYESVYIKREDFPEALKIEERDSSGYVTELCNEEVILEGMAFSEGYHLPSADFVFQTEGEYVRVECRGKGHGLGISQYGGNEMAKGGADYEQILNWYFPEGSIIEKNTLQNE